MVAEVKQNRAFVTPAILHSWFNRLGPVLGLVLVIVIFSILMKTPGRFLSPNNLRIVLSQTVIVAIGAIGMTMIIISGGIDLAVGSTIALTGVITALGIQSECHRRWPGERHSCWWSGWCSKWPGHNAVEGRPIHCDVRNAWRRTWYGQVGCR